MAGEGLRYALRTIRRMPGLAAVIVLSLGAGIGVNTVVFSWLQARVLDPIPGVRGGAEFYLVEPRTETGLYPAVSWPEYLDLRDGLSTFDSLLAFRMTPLYVGEPGSVERAWGLLVSDTYFDALGLRPHIGRFPTAVEMSPSGAPVAVMSHAFWQTRFAADPEVTARHVRINGRVYAIAGVTPEHFHGTVPGLTFDLWLPAALSPAGWRDLESRGNRGFVVAGRLARGATRDAAQAELDVVMRRLENDFPRTNASINGEVIPFWQSPRGPQRFITSAVLLLQGLMLLLMMAVCGNAANLVLARASSRQREMAIRLALGATRGRVFTLVLTEHLLLALGGAAVGGAIAVWGTEALRAVPMIRGLPVKFTTRVDATTVAFSIALGLLSGAIVGIAPALQLARRGLQTAFRAGAAPAGRHQLRHALMGVQVATSIVVLVAAGMFFRGFLAARNADPGFRVDGVLLAAYDFSGRATSDAEMRSFAARLLESLRALPAVEGAAIASSVPLDIHGLPTRTFALEGRARADAAPDRVLSNVVTPGYLEVMRIPIVAGTDFAGLNDPVAPPQAIVNDAFVQRYLPDAETLGRRIDVRGRRYTIVGVAANSRYNALDEPPAPVVYFSWRDLPFRLGEVHVRIRRAGLRRNETALAGHVRRIVRDLDAELPVFNLRTMTEHIDANLVFRRIPARMFAVLAPLLLALTAIGIYAVVAYTVSLRTAEIGVRIALGATPARVVAQLVGESLAVVATGALAGWGLALLGSRNLAASRASDILVFAGVPIVLLAVAALACWLPARRAAKLDPMIALRAE